MFVDYILNGQGFGPVGSRLMASRFEPGLMRPYIDSKGQKCVAINSGRFDDKGNPILERHTIVDMMSRGVFSPVFNAAALRKEEWTLMDQVVVKEARRRLVAWADAAAANSYGGFNGMNKTILEYEKMSDPGEAVVDMDGLSEGRRDFPRFQPEGLPLPITHVDFSISARQLATTRNGGQPFDVTMAEAAARRVAEKIEQTIIGTATGLAYGSTGTGAIYSQAAQAYGYTNFPQRNTKTDLTTPTGSNPESTVQDVLEMRDLLYADNMFGPYMLYHSTDWDAFMDNDYMRLVSAGNSVGSNQTLRDRLRAIQGIQDVKRLDFLTSSTNPYTLIMVQMTSDVVRAVNGMDITTIQWEEKGGMQLSFKVMAIMVPQLRADYSGRCGIVHATTS